MVTATMIYVAVVLVAALVGMWRARRITKRWVARSLIGFSVAVGLVATIVFVFLVATAAGDRSPRMLDLGSGVMYERIAIDEPHRQVLHVAVADLDNPCLGLITTRPAEGGEVFAETGTQYVERTGAMLSINVAFFRPFDEFPIWSSYPQSGDPVFAMGQVIIDGERLGKYDQGGDKGLAMTDGRLSANVVPADADFGVRGRISLVAEGIAVGPESPAYPRAVAGVDLDTNRLVLVVSDGKQPGYAEGSTYQGIAEFLIGLGVDEAVEFDGGGSATMAATVNGEVELLSRPIHQRFPGQERPVASHLGITIDPTCN